jgi:sarcosine oxidase delta subunit
MQDDAAAALGRVEEHQLTAQHGSWASLNFIRRNEKGKATENFGDRH